MAKLTQAQKAQFNNAKEWFGELEMRVFFSRELRMMIGIMPDGGMDNGLIYRTYVTLCHPNDDFKKKLGLIHLCEAYENDNFNRVRIHNSDVEPYAIEYMKLFAIANFHGFDVEEMKLN